MKKTFYKKKTQLQINEATIGDSIEIQMERLFQNGSDITETKALQYTREEDGVIAITDIRADKFDLAIEHTDKVTQSEKKKLEEKRKKREEIVKGNNNDTDVTGQSENTTPKTT